ncbi:MAG: glycosyl hydrolase, partial [Planctomycetaceae bacterium]
FKTGKGNAYETDLRDRKLGRVYRVVYKGEQATKPRRTLAGASPAELVAALSDTNAFWRRHAQRLLIERGQPDVVPALLKLVQATTVDEIGLNPGAIHALWTLKGLGQIEQPQGAVWQAVAGALRHPSAGVRRNAAQVLPAGAGAIEALAQAGTVADR